MILLNTLYPPHVQSLMHFGLILGDPLPIIAGNTKIFRPFRRCNFNGEILEESTYVAHHPQKIALIF